MIATPLVNILKVSCTDISYGKFTSELTFQNFSLQILAVRLRLLLKYT